MSQLVYTELEGQPLRWEFKGTVPREARQEASREPVSWSVNTTPTTQIQNTNTGTERAVYSTNQVAQTFKTDSQATKVTAVQFYGKKIGAPPNPLFVELRPAVHSLETLKVKRAEVFGPTTVDPQLNTTGVKTLLTMNTTLPGGKHIVIAALMPNAGFNDGGGSHKLRISKGTTVLYENPISFQVNQVGQKAKPIMIMAIDDSPAGYDTYTFEINTTTAGTSSGNVHVQGMVIKADTDARWARNTTAVSVSSGGTATVVTLSTNYPVGTKVVALAYVLGQPNTTSGNHYLVGAGNVKVKLGGNVVSSNQFNAGGYNNTQPLHTNLCFGTTLSTSTQTWTVEITNGSSVAFNVYAILVVFKVSDLAFLDTASVALSNGSQVTVGNLATSLQGNVAVIAIASAENTSSSSVTAFNANDVVLQLNNSSTGQISNYVGWLLEVGYGRSGNLPLFRFDTGVTNPSYQVKMTARANGINGEAKIVAFQPPEVDVVADRYTVLDDVLVAVSIAPSSVGTSDAWHTISIPAANQRVLRPNEYYALVFYTVGGDASNYYVLHSSFHSIIGTLLTSSNSGGTWNLVDGQDLSFKLNGVAYVRLYSGTIRNNIITPLGKVLVALIIKAQASGSMEFAGFDDHTLTAPVVTSNASSQTLITVLKPDDPRLRDAPPSDTLSWEIWGAGNGLATAAYTQRHTYYTKNPVYPRDFGFGELYLVADEIPPQGLVVLNDNTAAALFNSSTTAVRVDSYELFRVPVRKIEVVQEPTSGRIVLYLIGLP